MASRIQIRRDSASAWASSNPILADGEMGIEKDTLQFKFGDGVTAWSSLPYKGLDGADSVVPGPPGEQGIQGVPGQDSTVPGPPGADGVTPVKGVDYFDGEDSTVPGPKGDPGDPGTTTWAGITDKPSTFAPSSHGHAASEITGTAVVTNDSRLSDARTPTSHAHAAADITGTAVVTNDSRLSDARTPTAHDQATSTITGLDTALSGKEPANANIQTHVTAAHAPSGAQVNADITKAEIEAKLTGAITSHSHAGGTNTYAINVQALTSSPTDAQTVYFGMLPKAPIATANVSKVYVRAACTIKRVEIYVYSGTAGTNESWSLYVRKNNTSDTLIATVALATNERVFSNTGLSISMAAGDCFEIKGVQPTWATNPLTTIYGGYVIIEE